MINQFVEIRKLYRPLQPTVTAYGSNITYVEVPPETALGPFIFCYWQLKTEGTLRDPFNYRVVADGCIDVFFEMGKLCESFVMGFCKKYTEFPIGQSFNYVGVRFLPTMFPQLFKVDASDLSNRSVNLADVVPELAAFISAHIYKGMSLTGIKCEFDNYIARRLDCTDIDYDRRFYDAIHVILKNNGVLNIEKDLDTGISPRQLRRLFEFYIGDTAKTFSKVVRFQNILRAKPSTQSLRQNKLFYDAGYYDQAHFIKEFRNFYGVTPGKAFGR